MCYCVAYTFKVGPFAKMGHFQWAISYARLVRVFVENAIFFVKSP